jgi:SSS family solute:Na+ symporter
VIVCGVAVGWFVDSIDAVIKWIVAALWGGYTASNVLKWHWWRFNGYGYFWGMLAGGGASLVLPFAVPGLSALDSFPLILLLSAAGCVVGALLTEPDDERVLMSFYRSVRPWGSWGPILEKLRREEPGLQPNRDFGRDMWNVAVGIAWQTSLVVLPVALVIRKLDTAALALLTVAATTAILKLTWYDHLDRREAALQAAPPPASEEPPSNHAAPGRC